MIRKGYIGRARILHGLTGTALFYSWKNMMTRCYNPNYKRYEGYGGRGITVCELLRAGPQNLLQVIGDKPQELQLDRIDNDVGYHCGICAECLINGWTLNVRWSSRNVQARNRRDTRLETINGITKPIKDWAEEFGVSYNTVVSRWQYGVRGPSLFSSTPVKWPMPRRRHGSP